MKALYDQISHQCSKEITRTYSTSFSLGILLLHKELRQPIYNIYGFVRLADEIVDSFQETDQETLLSDFRAETYRALAAKISLNPVLHSFQETVNRFNIDPELIDTFLDSMAMDLQQKNHDAQSFQRYILGSAEVVGLMCLWVFCEGDAQLYAALEAPAMRLGAAFQKVNFLRDPTSTTISCNGPIFPSWIYSILPLPRKRLLKPISAEISAWLSKASGGCPSVPV